MAGLLGYALAGAAAGAGNGLVERAKSLAAAALEKRQADQRAAERAEDRAWGLQDLATKRNWDLQDANTQRQWDLQDAADARKPAEDATAAFNRLFGSDQPASADAVPASYVRDGLVARGIPLHAAEAFTLEGDEESGLRPGINEQNPTIAGSRGGFGIFQWTGPRRVELEKFAAARGTSASDIDTQLDFTAYELQGSESEAASKIMSARDRDEAGKAVATFFLRPREDHLARRVAKYDAAGPAEQGPSQEQILAVMSMPGISDGQRAVLKELYDQQKPKAPLSMKGKEAADRASGFLPEGAATPNFRAEGDLRKEFTNLQPVKNFQALSEAMGRISASAEKPDAAGDLSLIFAYMKMLDPTSVVRETEFANAQNAAGVPDQIRNTWNRLRNGERLNPDQRAEFTGRAVMLYNQAKDQYSRTVDQYRGIATAQGVDPMRAIPDFTYSGQMPAPAAPDGSPERPFKIQSVDDYNNLPSGATYVDPKGITRKKP